MKKYLSVIVMFLLMSTAAFAQDERDEKAELPKFPEASTVSIGSGAHWGGMLGANFVSVPEDSQFGVTVGAGWNDVEENPLGWNAGVVYRFFPEAGLFVSYGSAGVYGFDLDDPIGVVNGLTVSFGSIPVDSFDFVWRIGVGFLEEDFSNGSTVFDIGIGIAF